MRISTFDVPRKDSHIKSLLTTSASRRVRALRSMKKGLVTILALLAMMPLSHANEEIEGTWLTDLAALENSIPAELRNVMVYGTGDAELTEEEKKEYERDPSAFIRKTTIDVYRNLTVTIQKKSNEIYRLSFKTPHSEEADESEMILKTEADGSLKLVSEDGVAVIGLDLTDKTLLLDGIGPVTIPFKRKGSNKS